jgi:ribosome-associated protein
MQHHVAITGPFIELYKLLKRENIAASGGEAKYLISEGLVRVNGQVEFRKRYKTRPGDTISFQDWTVTVTSADLSI